MNDYTSTLNWIDDQREKMIEKVIELANLNSGSHNLAGLKIVSDHLTHQFSNFDCDIKQINLPTFQTIDNSGNEVNQSVGKALAFSKHRTAPVNVLLMGHMDTVYGEQHPFQTCQWLDKNTLNGPGVADLKGGLVILYIALSALERSPFAGKIGWQVLINPDEEIGSLSSSTLIEQAATQNDLGLIFEPSLPDGTLAGARKGSGNFTIIATGKAAHAGREHHLGRNAIAALSTFTTKLNDLNGEVDGITINPGFIHGGGPVNIVPDQSVLKFNVRISDQNHENWFLDQLTKLINQANLQDGINLSVHGGFGRKPKNIKGNTRQLFELIRDTGLQLNTNIHWKDTGGCCDGNNLAAAGLANVDTMGAIGGSIHSSNEYIDVNSLTQRAKLTALFLMRLANNELKWHG